MLNQKEKYEQDVYDWYMPISTKGIMVDMVEMKEPQNILPMIFWKDGTKESDY